MTSRPSDKAWEFYAETYDATMNDWPGEIDFYKRLAGEAPSRGGEVLELACGTGRVAIQLVRAGVRVVGLDISKPMLEIARVKARGLANSTWVEGDMRGASTSTSSSASSSSPATRFRIWLGRRTR